MNHHLVFTVRSGFVEFRIGDRSGSHPIGDDTPEFVMDYLKSVIPHDSSEIIEEN